MFKKLKAFFKSLYTSFSAATDKAFVAITRCSYWKTCKHYQAGSACDYADIYNEICFGFMDKTRELE